MEQGAILCRLARNLWFWFIGMACYVPRVWLSNHPNRLLTGRRQLWGLQLDSPIKLNFCSPSSSAISTSTAFTWDDVVRVSQPDYASRDSVDLSGFFHKITSCNRGCNEMQIEFVRFLVNDQIVGYVHRSFAEKLMRFKDVFTFIEKESSGGFDISLDAALKTPEERTRAIGKVIKSLSDEGLIPGIRNELYPVTTSYGGYVFFSMERAAAPYFGIKAYGVHMNGFVEKDGKKYLWIGRRSEDKPTFPGMLDHLVAGGLASGMSCRENLVKECEEEAGIPPSVSHKAIPVGAVSYLDIDGYRYKRDVLFCYDLKLPESFVPKNQDGEVGSFRLMPVANVANVIKRTQCFKPNCNLVIMDFLFRHGFITPECQGYLNLLVSLRRGVCS